MEELPIIPNQRRNEFLPTPQKPRTVGELANLMAETSAALGIRAGGKIGYSPSTLRERMNARGARKDLGMQKGKDYFQGKDGITYSGEAQLKLVFKALDWLFKKEETEERRRWTAEILKNLS